MKKYNHIVVINGIDKANHLYLYQYRNTKGIEMSVSNKGIKISASFTRKYNKDELLTPKCYWFNDAINKAMIVYLLRYSKELKIKTITLSIDDEEPVSIYQERDKVLIYSMIDHGLIRKLPQKYHTEEVVHYILNTAKTRYDRRISSLFSVLYSKSKKFETERFIYLWTAMNGVYGWLSNRFIQNKKPRESEQILTLSKYLNIGNAIIKDGKEIKNKTRIANIVISLLQDVEISKVNRNYIDTSGLNEKIRRKLVNNADGKIYDITGYGYLLLHLSYYFRCKFIHGDAPLMLFTKANDSKLHCLEILNALLEEFLDEMLPMLFDEQYIKDVVEPKMMKIILK